MNPCTANTAYSATRLRPRSPDLRRVAELNPDRILLDGLHKDLLEADPERLRAAVAERSPWGRGSRVPVLGCALDSGSLIGAAELAWQPVLDDPGLLTAGPGPDRAAPDA